MKVLELNKIKNILNIDESETGFDEILTDIAEGAETMIESFLGISLLNKTFTESLNGDDCRVVLNNYPLTEIVKFEVLQNNEFVEKTDLRFSQRGVVDFQAPCGFQNVKVEYKAGFETCPSDIENLIKKIVIRQYRKLENEGEKTTNFGASSLTWDNLINEDDEKLLEKYRRYLIN